MDQESNDRVGAAEPALVQMRDVTTPEAMRIYKAAAALQMPGLQRDHLVWLCYAGFLASWAVIVACALALSAAIKDAGTVVAPYAAHAVTMLFGGLTFLSVAQMAYGRRVRTMAARGYAKFYAPGNRYQLRSEGIAGVMQGTHWTIPWQRIESVANDELLLIATVPPVQVLALPKDAFAGQDAAAFCAELERRWKEQRMHDQAVGDRPV